MKQNFLAPLVAGCAALVLFLCGVAPTLSYGGDCGELIAASWRLGIAHPTGYAFYCLAARTFAALFPAGEIAWRYNVFSAFCGAGAVALLAATIQRILAPQTFPSSAARPEFDRTPHLDFRTQFAAGGGALLLAGFYYFWSQCVIAEVYATAALFFSALLFCAVSWRQSADWRWLYSLSLLFGLALNAHLSCVYLAPGLAIYTVWAQRARFQKQWLRHGARLVLLFVAGYSIAVYLPLRSATFPVPTGDTWTPLDWTHPVDGARFVAHASARQYRNLLLTTQQIGGFTVPAWVQSGAETRAKLGNFAGMSALQLLWCTPLAFLGCAAAFRRERALGMLLLLTFALNIGVQIHYTVGDLSNFFFPAYMSLGIWLGLGIEAVARRISLRVLVPIVASAWLAQIALFFPLASQRDKTAARDDALARAATIEKLPAAPTVFLLSDDALWAFWYAKFVLRRAPRAQTPWGPPRTRALKNDTLWKMVKTAKTRGPVVLSQYDDATDRRFPLVPANAVGDLWLASNRELPLPAAKESAVEIDRTRSAVAWRARRTRNQIPQLKRSDMAACDVTFALPRAFSPIAQSAKEKSAHYGWIELFIATEKTLKIPTPAQQDIRTKSAGAPPLAGWRVARRLVLPLGAKSGVWRATIPVTLEKDARLGRYDVWMRVVEKHIDTRVVWQRASQIDLTDS